MPRLVFNITIVIVIITIVIVIITIVIVIITIDIVIITIVIVIITMQVPLSLFYALALYVIAPFAHWVHLSHRAQQYYVTTSVSKY